MQTCQLVIKCSKLWKKKKKKKKFAAATNHLRAIERTFINHFFLQLNG